jgi:hypothetical protein
VWFQTQSMHCYGGIWWDFLILHLMHEGWDDHFKD